MKKVSTRFPDPTRQTGGGSIVISHKPSMKLKTLIPVDGMGKSTCNKRVRLPKKILDDDHTVNLVSVPRKLRSVMKKRYAANVLSRCEMSFLDGNKKLKVDPVGNLKLSHIVKRDEQPYSVAKDEEEAIAGLLALAGIDNTHEIKLNNKIPDATASKSEYLVQKYAQIDPNEIRNSGDAIKDLKDVTDGNNTTRKRCASHVYICRIIKNLQITKGKMVNSHKESKSKTTQENVTGVKAGINLNEPIMVSKTIFQEHESGCRVQPYFGNPFCDPSQWSRPLFSKQQMWMNPLVYKPPQLGSYVQQASLQNVLASKEQQQFLFNMQLDHHPFSGYDENGVSFRVDSPPTLKLALR